MTRLHTLRAMGLLGALLATNVVATPLASTPSRDAMRTITSGVPAAEQPTLVAGTVRQAGRGPQPKTVPKPSEGPWTYLATYNAKAVFIDMASIRRPDNADDGDYVEAWVLFTDGKGADIWLLDVDCELKASRIRHMIREDEARTPVFQAANAGSWSNINPGTTLDRIRITVCRAAKG